MIQIGVQDLMVLLDFQKDYSLQFFGFLRGPSENAFSKK